MIELPRRRRSAASASFDPRACISLVVVRHTRNISARARVRMRGPIGSALITIARANQLSSFRHDKCSIDGAIAPSTNNVKYEDELTPGLLYTRRCRRIRGKVRGSRFHEPESTATRRRGNGGVSVSDRARIRRIFRSDERERRFVSVRSLKREKKEDTARDSRVS